MVFLQAVIYLFCWSKIGRLMADTMADENNLEKRISSIMKRFNRGEITCCQAKEEMRELILDSETVGDLELAHKAYDKLGAQ